MEVVLKHEDDGHVPQTFGVGPITKFLALREIGLLGRRSLYFSRPKSKIGPQDQNESADPLAERTLPSSNACVNQQADEVGEERLIVKEFETLQCKLNGSNTRSTFLMVFSPDKLHLASTHGDHNIYISEVKTGNCVQTLTGHPRTPWCIAFHPTKKNVLASGCLGGIVRIWDIQGGGSEIWRTDGVIASLTFHPFDNVLVFSTVNEIHFWDWSEGDKPFAKVKTNSEKERVRYVKFDATGHHLITGIANLTGGRSGIPNSVASLATAERTTWRPWNRGPGHAAVAEEHLYPLRDVNAQNRRSPSYGRYRGQPNFAAAALNRDNDPMLSSTMVSDTPPGNLGSARTAATPLRRPVSTRNSTSSASQTLSDLAAAASDQLMAENAAASGNEDLFFPSAESDQWLSPQNNPSASATTPADTSVEASALPFSHSAQSSFEEVQEDSAFELWRRRRQLSTRRSQLMRRNNRILELLDRRESLVNQIEELRSARDILSNGNEYSASTSAESPGRTLRGSSSTVTTDSLYPAAPRPIDEWAMNRRLRLENNLLPSEPLGEFPVGGFDENSPASSARATMLFDYRDRHPLLLRDGAEERRPDPPLPPLQPDVLAEPESLSRDNVGLGLEGNDQVRNDHTYTQRPREAAALDEEISSEPGPSRRSNPLSNHNLDIVLLSRHIAHMQRICRASLQDCSRQRRQVVRLQSIRRMLEDLQRQIRSLRAASVEEVHRGGNTNPESEAQPEDPIPEPEAESLVRTSPGNLLDDRNYDERVGEGEHLAQLRNISRTLSWLNRNRVPSSTTSPSNRRPGLLQSPLRSSRSPSSHLRAYSRIMSQMRATFRAFKMSPDLARRGSSPVNLCNAEASRNVMASLQSASTSLTTATSSTFTTSSTSRPSTSTTTSCSNATLEELRALSQRLEGELRSRRESSTVLEEPLQEPDPEPEENLEIRPLSMLSSVFDTESESDSDTSRLGFDSTDTVRGPSRYISSHALSDLYDNAIGGSGNRRPSLSRNLATDRLSRTSFQDRVDSLRELRRIAIQDRRRRLRDRERRRYRLLDTLNYLNPSPGYAFHRNYSSFATPLGQQEEEEVADPTQRLPRPRLGSDVLPGDDDVDALRQPEPATSDRLPPLRELIWRRLRRRNAQLNRLDEEITTTSHSDSIPPPPHTRERTSRHRELLSWMVDQMRIDHSSPSTSGPSNTVDTNSFSVEPPLRNTASPRPESPPRLNLRSGDHSTPIYGPGSRLSTRSMGIGTPTSQAQQRLQQLYNQREQHYFLNNTPASMLLTHRIQCWDFSHGDLPDVSSEDENVVVKEAKIHNDASVDISEDGTLLVTLVPSYLPMTTVVGVYGLLPEINRGQCYATYSLESSAVSVSLSPTSRHLLVGLAIRSGRITLTTTDRTLMAQIFRIKLPWERNTLKGRLVHRRDLHQSQEQGLTSLNCVRWIPVPGQGLVYATTTGLLKILR